MLYQISAGQGLAECELGEAKLLNYFQNHYDISVTDFSPGQRKDTFRSVRFTSEDNLSNYLGSIKWIRPHHKRKNWFIDFSICVTSASQKFNPDHVMFETFRSSDKGGQNVNKVETGVRAIYLPTGQLVLCTEERSQHANKQKALSRLKTLHKSEKAIAEAKNKSDHWSCHTQIKRGNPSKYFR